MTSTIKADVVTAQTTNGDLSISGNGSGVPNLETGFKVGGTAGVPVSALRAGTDGELITWAADASATTVPVGTATHVLTSNGAGTAPTFQAAAGGGAWTLIGSQVASDDASVEQTGLDSTYDVYAFQITNMRPASSGVNVMMKFGDSGAYYAATGDYTFHIEEMRGGTVAYDASGYDYSGYSEIEFRVDGYGVANTAPACMNMTAFLHGVSGTTFIPTLVGQYTALNTQESPFAFGCGSLYAALSTTNQSAIDMTKFSIRFNSGNIAVGRISTWGIKHT